MESPDAVRVIAGRYELQSLIGEGGMASVWRARDLTLERAVAVKVLFARDERDRQKLVKQFVREARIAASVQHRNVIHIVDFGTTEQQQPYMVMELLEGESLGQRMHREPRVTVEEVLHVASLTLRGLMAVHAAGIVHRDLKPDNIFLVRDAASGLFPKILDFGISRSVEPRSGRRSALTTQEGIIVGTPEYMSPEQARGLRNLDHRTDLYSMGVILYEALTGRLPFSDEHVGDLIIQIVTAHVRTVHELVPSVPKSISDVVAKAMSREREDRFTDAAEMQRALLAAAAEVFPNLPRSLSELPPTSADAGPARLPRISLDRLRTLEFPLDAGGPEIGVLQVPGMSLPRSPRPGSPLPAISDIEVTDSDDAVASSAPLEWPPSTKRPRWIRPAVATLAAALCAGLLLFARAPSPDADGVKATPLTVSASKAAEAAAAKPRTSAVSLRNVPDGARIEVDGVSVPGARFELPRDDRERTIRVTLAGSEPWQTTHVATSDGEYEVALTPIPVAAAASTEESSRPKAATGAAARRRAVSGAEASNPRRSNGSAQKPPSALRHLDF